MLSRMGLVKSRTPRPGEAHPKADKLREKAKALREDVERGLEDIRARSPRRTTPGQAPDGREDPKAP